MTKLVAVAILGGLLLGACGGEPEPKNVEPVTTTTAAPPDTGPHIVASQELGSIDDRAVSQKFDQLGDKFKACQDAATKRLPFIAGSAKFFMRVGPDGRVKWSYLEDSSLGDFETEKCLLGTINDADWPKPIGGDATVERDLTFDVGDARPPAEWTSDRVAATVGKHKKALDKCLGPAGNAKFNVTAYVEPHGKEGKVVAAGVSTSSKEGQAQAECIVDAVKAMKMPSPGSYAAKVGFGL
jgi:hypothetical protein